MKILFLIRSFEIGGAERQMALLASALKNQGHNIMILSYYPGGAITKELLDKGLEVVSLGKKSRWDVIGFLCNFIRKVRDHRPQILYSFMTTSNLLSLLPSIFMPNLKIIWGIRASNMDLDQYDKLSKMTFWLEKKLSFFPNRIIANSDAGKTYITKMGFSDEKIAVIANGIDTERFFSDDAKRKKMRDVWQVKENEILIGMVARIDPMKDYATFFKMAAILSQKKKNFRFLAMGSSNGSGNKEYQVTLKLLLNELNLQDTLLWVEEQLEVTEVYNALDIFCLSSAFGEGFSNVLAEAMACGIPCVATEVGDAGKIVGELGAIVPIKDPEKMAKACLSLLEKEINKTSLRQRILDHFSVATMVNSTERILNEVLINSGKTVAEKPCQKNND